MESQMGNSKNPGVWLLNLCLAGEKLLYLALRNYNLQESVRWDGDRVFLCGPNRLDLG